ncbi:MAG: VWA domain-containing protein [Pseudomonadales bacterium]
MAKKSLTSTSVERFLQQVQKVPTPTGSAAGRLVFALDATASREPTWDTACHLQAEMFHATSQLGGLSVQLCYYRGFGEFHASGWSAQSSELLQRMSAVGCRAGHTQIAAVLRHALAENKRHKIAALVFVGDAMEENPDALCDLAGQFGVVGTRIFMFHEGRDAMTASVFRQIAELSGGAYLPFDASSAAQLKDLLAAVAVFAAGGAKALERYSRGRRSVTQHLAGLLTQDRDTK